MTTVEQSVLDAFQKDEQPATTARRLGVSPQRISEIRARLRKQGLITAPPRKGTGMTELRIHLLPETLEAVHTAAEKRGLSIPSLVRRLVDAIATDKMFDAVLDDEA